ncbi:50S ribosomal protein L11 methyltransferase [Asticcacaulis tiandongensis]|uniref:50S ribosomal protein L11 methyltransferase n=1 Tax=Asticcacaulis tiandongensis TaxID=2565365 RepID=UPI00112C3F57|nr:50S ribosomal protein L11 methyltransferase [Asticcacaulis tiandongensis]
MTYNPQQIIAKGPRQVAETAAEAIDDDILLEGVTYSILEEDEDRNIWRIDAFPTTEEEDHQLQEVLKNYSELTVNADTLADADWLSMALSGLPPVRAGRFFVYGIHDRGKKPQSTVNLRIEAGAAFGTGHHGTTVGCLQAYDELLKKYRFERVLDVGAGTGVLAIAASKTGTTYAVGTDIDPVSVRISNENAKLNTSNARFVWANGLNHKDVRQRAPYDLVFANILARPLVSLSQSIKTSLKPGGIVILSGLLRTQERFVKAAYLSKGFRVIRRIHRDAWCTLVMKRNG